MHLTWPSIWPLLHVVLTTIHSEWMPHPIAAAVILMLIHTTYSHYVSSVSNLVVVWVDPCLASTQQHWYARFFFSFVKSTDTFQHVYDLAKGHDTCCIILWILHSLNSSYLSFHCIFVKKWEIFFCLHVTDIGYLVQKIFFIINKDNLRLKLYIHVISSSDFE